MSEAARAGGVVLREYFGQGLDTIEKSMASDFKTKADEESEAAVLAILEKAYPNYNIHSEEVGKINHGSEYEFVIDPMDGTNNFVLGLPNFTVAIALMRKDETVAAVVYAPMIDHLYYTEKGKGAFLNEQQLHVSSEKDFRRATVAHTCLYEAPRDLQSKIFREFYMGGGKRMLANWSPQYDLCMIAAGKVEGMIANGSQIYDFAAGKLLCKEAGAQVTDHQGTQEENDRNSEFLISNTEEINKFLQQVVSKI